MDLISNPSPGLNSLELTVKGDSNKGKTGQNPVDH
jgi:hypothetical protein